MKRLAGAALCALAFVPTGVFAQRIPPPPTANITFTPDRPSGVYDVGEPVGWTVRAPMGMGPTRYTWVARENNGPEVASGVLDLKSGEGRIETRLPRPGMLYVRLSHADASAPAPTPTADELAAINAALARTVEADAALKSLIQRYPDYAAMGPTPPPSAAELDKLTVAAAVAPTRIGVTDPRPADFDAFWAGRLRAQAAIPINPKETPVPGAPAGVDLSVVTLDALGSTVHGYLAKPTKPGKYPALIVYQYAGVYPLRTDTATNRAEEGWLTFNIQAHDMAPDQATAPRNYGQVGNDDRESSYFLGMYLRATRALEYVRSRADWDGRTVVLMGTSQGGQQSLVTAALNPDKVTALVVNVPAGGDLNGDLYGRSEGFPNWRGDNPRQVEAARYFDIVNFAPSIRAASLIALGYLDTVSTPVGVFAAFNQIKGPKEAVAMVESDHNHITPQKQDGYYRRAREALAELRKTGRLTLDGGCSVTPGARCGRR
jgi:cephalosporin-C deacetylase-like acetyl esterase